jgi:hypothetical protein
MKQQDRSSMQERAAEALRVLLDDNEWHPAEKIRPKVQRLASGCHAKTVNRAKRLAGVEIRNRRGARGRTDWRIPRTEGGS